ncbi:SRF-TF domain-containing protein/K-box domain-containing protein [Cephalotus follicularis]|uniref:SRF-TF domain-containing protein/K-box domain-containing protein n=1 Tax=Cephalotus follicularis TaxID=3775 RepID=A0A1Q3BC47_CEPFO|nr:SRF-TF domain-containing protein/K-box domain-containing protein [Cephalotus follicularis]
MARGKVQMKRIENPVHRQVTFCKRRAGLLKKAKELSVLCDAEIGLVIFSAHGKLFELTTKGTMQELIERYLKSTGGAQPDQDTEQPLAPEEEINMLKQEIEMLRRGLSYMFGGGSTATMTLDDLLVLEKHLEIGIYNVRSAKMEFLFQEIQLLKNKEGILKTANKNLQDQIEENVGFANSASMITNIPYPLTIQSEIFQF